MLLLGVTGFALSRGGDESVQASSAHDLKVSLVDIGQNAAPNNCLADQYSGLRLSGTRITVLIADGSIAGTVQVTGDGSYLADVSDVDLVATDGCSWEASMPGIPDSAAYTVRLEGPKDLSQTLTYSKAELEKKGWKLDLANNF